MLRLCRIKIALLCLAFHVGGSYGDRTDNESNQEHNIEQSYSPYVKQNYPANVYWGDTHLHTSLSWDAYAGGNKRLDPDAAYRFAKGEALNTSGGVPVKIHRPLDFLVVADHASNMGVMQGLEAGDSRLLASPLGQRIISKIQALSAPEKKNDKLEFSVSQDGFYSGSIADKTYLKTVWDDVIAAADHHNDPGHFTAFIGYEWTQLFYWLHRVVIFKDDGNKAGQVTPFSQFDGNDPESLWAYMKDYEENVGGQVLAIPHNSNLSKGVMFALEDVNGNPLSTRYAKSRSRWEPLLEVTQAKGDSETHPLVSSADEFADFETFTSTPPYKNTWTEALKKFKGSTHYNHWVQQNNREKGSAWMHQYEYARPALKLGLEQQAKLGINPFKFGMIGSTDNHSSLAAADEDNFLKGEPTPGRSSILYKNLQSGPINYQFDYIQGSWQLSAAGYAAVWAEENTRESLFAAMKRREVYASSGPRINVRFFGGWDYHTDDAFKPDLARIGYEKGVPMGGDLTAATPKDKSPTFLIRAVKDPKGANLDRVQVIKGWRDANGDLHEKIYNVALSDNRKPNWHGKVKPVGNTVDITDASYTNTIGDPELAVVWQDPDFNSDELAFYYLRVLEIPTPRWTAYDAKYFQLKDLSEQIPMIIQERAYSSPIWYTP